MTDARNETQATRFEAENVLTSLIETERSRTVELRADMATRLDLGRALLKELQAERVGPRPSWLDRLLGQHR